MFYEFPSEPQWETLLRQFPRDRLTLNREPFFPLRNDIVAGVKLLDVLCHWDVRRYDLQLSYGMVMFYFRIGIPDDNWVNSSGDSGATFEYFPDFTERDQFTKQLFDYHSEVFFLKIFSCWDTIGHILNFVYELNLDARQVKFTSAVDKLKARDGHLFEQLSSICKDASFEKAREIRNNYAHNYIPSTVGPSIRRVPGSEDTYEGHAGEYTTSKEIVLIAQESLELLALTVEHVGHSRDPNAPRL